MKYELNGYLYHFTNKPSDMRVYLFLLLAGLFFIPQKSYTQKDTTLARQLLREADSLRKQENDYEASMNKLEKAQQIISDALGKNTLLYIQYLSSKGKNQRYLSRTRQSIKTFEEAIARMESMEDYDEVQYAFLLGELAGTLSSQGNYEKAITYYDRVSGILEKQFDSNDPNLAVHYYNIGNAYLGKEAPQLALPYFFKALKIDEALGDELYIADDYDNIALAYQQEGNYDKALDYYNKAIELFRATVGEKNEYTLHTMKLKGECLNEIALYREGADILKRAALIANTILEANSTETAEIFALLGQAYVGLGKIDSAGIAFKNAFRAIAYSPDEPLQLSQVNSLEALTGILEDYGYFLEKRCEGHELSCLQEAADIYLNAVSIVDTIRFSYREKGAKLDIARNAEPHIEGGIRVLTRLYEGTGNTNILKQIFRLAEKDKGFLLLESLVESRAENFARIPPVYLKKLDELESAMAFLEGERFKEKQAGAQTNQEKINALNARLFEKKKALFRLKDEIEEKYPGYYNLKYSIDVTGLDQAQRDILQYNEAIINYFVGETEAYAIVVKPDEAAVIRLGSSKRFQILTEELREGLYGYFLSPSDQQTQEAYDAFLQKYQDAAHQLYQIIFKPLEAAELPERLTIIPDAVLGYIPFDALLSEKADSTAMYKDYPFLASQYNISYTYSTSLLKEFMQKSSWAKNKSILAFAPEFRGSRSEVAGVVKRRSDLGSLKFNVPEVEAITEIFPGMALTGQEATESAFRKLSSNYQILHLSTHGKANDNIGDYSYLAFSAPKGEADNELLYVRDLYSLTLNADMVVLSACETGIGELKKGEGIISLANGFSYAGAKSIITTLWSVNDAQTKDIIVRFYNYLDQGLAKDKALQEAKLDYIKESKNAQAHPFYWAGYIPMGDMSNLKGNPLESVDYWTLGFVVMIVIFVIFTMSQQGFFKSE